MGFNFADRPTGHIIADTGQYLHTFYEGETITLTYTSVGTAAAGTYEVRDYYGNIVTGPTTRPASPITLPALPLGWYKIYFRRTTPIADPWYAAGGELMFTVVRNTGLLRARPAAGTTKSNSRTTPNVDWPARGMMGFGSFRHAINIFTNWATDIAEQPSEVALEQSSWWTDANRPKQSYVAFSDGTGGTAPTGTDVTRIQTAVTTMMSNGCSLFECRNEIDMWAPDQITNAISEVNAFAGNVHGANAAAKVMAPCSVEILDAKTRANDAFRAVYSGIAANIDIVSFHHYNGTNGDLAVGRKVLDDWVTTLVDAGVSGKPRWMTEWGSIGQQCYGAWQPHLQVQWVMLDTHLLEQHGVPKERVGYYYDRGFGYWDFPSFWETGEGTEFMPGPLFPVFRVWSEELHTKTFTAALDFGTVENNHFIGSKFTNSGTGVAVVAVQSAGREGQVSFTVTGASSVTVIDPFGISTVKTVTGGLVTLDVTALPQYIRLPSGVNAVPVAVDYGTEVARAQPGTTTTASTNAAGSATVIDAKFGTPYNNNWASTLFQTTDGVGAWWELDFPTITRFDRVVIYCPYPWQTSCSLLDFNIKQWTGSAWSTVATVTEPTPNLQWTSYKTAGACYVEDYYKRTRIWSVKLATPAETTKMRVLANALTYGGGATLAQYQPTVPTGLGIIGQAGPRLLSLQEVQVFLSGGGGGGAVRGQAMLIQPR